MKKISPKKLLHSKWTTLVPMNKEKHFTIIDVEYDEEQRVTKCIIQAIMTKVEYEIDWRILNEGQKWLIGWNH